MLAGTVSCKIYLKNTAAIDFGSAALDWSIESATATLVYNNDPSSVISNTRGFKNLFCLLLFYILTAISKYL